jgi:hypothetical protein
MFMAAWFIGNDLWKGKDKDRSKNGPAAFAVWCYLEREVRWEAGSARWPVSREKRKRKICRKRGEMTRKESPGS